MPEFNLNIVAPVNYYTSCIGDVAVPKSLIIISQGGLQMITRQVTKYRVASALIVASTFLAVMPKAYAEEGIRWLNRWDLSCYQQESNVNSCRQEWYKTSQGSHLIMWEVFKTIEEENTERLFSDRNSLSDFGFLFPEQQAFDAANTQYNGSYGERVERDISVDGMPIGFLRDKSQLDNRNYLGLTCAACHTGEITYQGSRYYIEGGQSNSDVDRFLNKLADSLEANKNDSRKLRRFKDRFRSYTFRNKDWSAAPINIFAGERYLDEAIRYVRGFVTRNRNVVENGPGRLDAIGSILNQVHVLFTGDDGQQAQPLTAPVSLPYIWDVSKLECVQTNCISNSPIVRNVGEVLGVFGYVNLDEDENVNDRLELAFRALSPLFDSTSKVDNIHRLEKSLSYVSPPKWPASLPAVDQRWVDLGKTVYQQNCAACHADISDGIQADEMTEPNSIGRQYVKIGRVPYDEVGTDPAFAEDYGLRKAKTKILGSVLREVAPDSVDPETGIRFGDQVPEELNALVLLGVTAQVITSDHFDSLGFRHLAENADRSLPANQAVEKLEIEYNNGQVDRNLLTPTSYRAKPLSGIAFTGPYLHNGSVRSLWELLHNPAQRARTFNVGSKEYDPVWVGYENSGSFVFDTTKRGNSNAGHVYGTELGIYDKFFLLQYLKTL